MNKFYITLGKYELYKFSGMMGGVGIFENESPYNAFKRQCADGNRRIVLDDANSHNINKASWTYLQPAELDEFFAAMK